MTVIVALGDSTTAGTPGFRSPIEAPPDGDGNVESQYAYWLARANPDWRILNRGVNGERSDEIAARFERDVVRASPAAVILIAGVNDVYQGLPADVPISQLSDLYDRASRAGILVVAGSIVPYDTASDDANARMDAINAWIAAEAARDSNVAFADTRRAVASADDPNRLSSSPDGLHPDADGYRRMAEAIAPVLEAHLSS
jgi:lysophospholipase L1-like esterase